MTAALKRAIRVTLVSPGDVQAERDQMEDVIHNVNALLKADHKPVVLELERWETTAIPGLHNRGAQGRIDESLQIDHSDIVVGVFGQRMGTPVDDAASGTEHELKCAIESWKTKGTPWVMLYANKQDYEPSSEQDQEQWECLNEFKKRLDLIALIKPFTDTSSFVTAVTQDLFSTGVLLAESVAEMQARGLQFEAAVEPVVVRADGYTELLGTVFIRCTYESAKEPPLHLSVSVILNLACTVTSPSPVLFEVARVGASAFVGGQVRGCEVQFMHIKLDGIKPHEIRIFQIVGLRCNAHPFHFAELKKILMQVSATGGPVKNDLQVVADVRRGIQFEAMGPHPGQAPPTEPRLFPLATLRFREGFAHAFKHAGVGKPTSSGDDWFVLDGESPFLGTAAAHGTRVLARFTCLCPQVRLFIGAQSRTVRADQVIMLGQGRMVESDSTLRTGGDQFAADGVELRELGLSNDSYDYADAAWEVLPVYRTNGSPLVLDFVVYAIYEPGPVPLAGALQHLRVGGGFFPVNAVRETVAAGVLNTNMPTPRFSLGFLLGAMLPLSPLKGWSD